MTQKLRGSWARGWFLLNHAVNKLFVFLWDVIEPKSFVSVSISDRALNFAFKTHHLVGQLAQSPDIGRIAMGLATFDLWSKKVGSRELDLLNYLTALVSHHHCQVKAVKL